MFPERISRALQRSPLNIVVTGAGGWLGQASLQMLADTLGDTFENRVFAFGSHERTLSLSAGRKLPCSKLDDLSRLPKGRYVFLHYAFLTKDRVPQMTLDQYVRANAQITAVVEAAMRRVDTVGAFVPSSGAVYRPDRSIETDLEANPYGVMKYSDEQHFAALAQELGFRLALVRVFNLAGPHINKVGSYALASILTDIIRGHAVVLRATQPVIRSYVHVEDLVALALSIVLNDAAANIPAFDTAGEVEVEVGDLARRAVKLLQREDIAIERPPLTSHIPNRYVGDAAVWRSLAKRLAMELVPLDTQILDTAHYLQNAIL